MQVSSSTFAVRAVTGVIALSVLASCGDQSQVAAPPQTDASAVTSAARSESVTALADCEDVPDMTTEVIGDLAGGANPDDRAMSALVEYGRAHADVFGGLWIDRDAFGTVVVAFTDDAESRRAEIAELLPDGFAFDVVDVTYTEDELVDGLSTALDVLRTAGFATNSGGVAIQRNRIAIESSDPLAEGDRGAMAEVLIAESGVPLDAVCVWAADAPAAPPAIDPDAPLDAIPSPGSQLAEATLLECNGTEFTAAALAAPRSLDEIDHDLLAVLDGWLSNEEEGSSWPQDGWVALYDDGDRAQFVSTGDRGASFVGAERGPNGWTWSGASSGDLCDVRIVSDEGLGRVDWELDPAFGDPDAETTEIHVLATERACTSATPMGDRLVGPQVVESVESVLISFAVIPLTGDQDCPGNPSTPITITLDAPLGDRTLVDGLVVGRIDELLTD